jgi:MSHA biogenesis protein MshK
MNIKTTIGISAILSAGVFFCASAVTAQGISDPTRPPAAVSSDRSGDAGALALPVLHSIKITPTERSAIIGDETVRQGGKYGDARVIRITENEVVLRSAAGTDTLRLYPDVSVKPIVPEPAVSKKPSTKKRAPAPTSQGKSG